MTDIFADTVPLRDQRRDVQLDAIVRLRWLAVLGQFAAIMIVAYGFEFDMPAKVAETPAPSPETLTLMREVVAPQLAEVYPQFAAQVFGVGKAALTG
jgi:hypothetical protein